MTSTLDGRCQAALKHPQDDVGADSDTFNRQDGSAAPQVESDAGHIVGCRQGEEEEELRLPQRGRSRSRSQECHHHHRHHSHHHQSERTEHRKHGSRSPRREERRKRQLDRSPAKRAHSAERQRSRSPHRQGHLAPLVEHRAPSPAIEGATPTRRVVHESTLVSLRPSVSPRAFPVAVTPFAAEEAPPASPALRLSLAPLVFGTAQAKGMRPYMEDRHTIVEPMLPRGSSGAPIPDDVPRSFAAVYDGHNGTLAADHAAERLHFILAAEPALRTCTGDGPPAATARDSERIAVALTHAFETTDREILTRCRVEGVRGGATGVVVLRIGDILYAAHCGDSRAVMCRGGAPLRLTEDHKPNLPRERQRVEGLGGRVDFARCWRVIVDPGDGRPASGLAVSRSFGDPDFKEPLHLVTATPDVMSERLTAEDAFVILASDGLWDVMSDKEACDVVARRVAAAAGQGNGDDRLLAAVAAEALVQASLDAGTMDNVTAVVGLLNWV